jgi:hypothetical protein
MIVDTRKIPYLRPLCNPLRFSFPSTVAGHSGNILLGEPARAPDNQHQKRDHPKQIEHPREGLPGRRAQ